MLSIISGAVLVTSSSLAFWRLLPDNGREHRLAENSGVSSMITITIMTAFTFGLAMIWNGLSG
jgi:hypothetical protein